MILSLIVAACAAGSLTQGSLSSSKLSIQMLDDRYTRGAQQIVAAGPRVLKLFDLGPGMRRALADYKYQHPDGKVVVRIWTTLRWRLSDNPEKAGEEYWDKVLSAPFYSLSRRERKWINYWEGPNEGDCTPTWASVDEVRWFNRFWLSLMRKMKQNGAVPNIGSIPVGNPGGSPAEVRAKLAAFLPAFQEAARMAGSWGYHAYTIDYSTDLSKEIWFSLRYRMIYQTICSMDPRLASMPLILTEGGVDRAGNAYEDGWVSRGSAQQFEDWLKWFDGELRKDPYVLGVTLFQSGGFETWPSFELEAFTPRLVRLLRSP